MTALLIASTGGHLAQLHRLRRHLPLGGSQVLWVTFDTPQSRSLLDGEHVHYLPYTGPRDWRRVVANTRGIPALVRQHRVESAYSTGSGIALSVLPVASRLGVRCHYIESAARSDAPSLTGRLLSATPGVQTYTQYDAWASRRWRRSVSVFDDFIPHPGSGGAPVRKVVVMLGTIEGFSFRALLDKLVPLVPAGVEVLWQTGETSTAGLHIPAEPMLPHHVLRDAIRAADVVVCHSGIGSALDVLDAGKVPVMVPRRKARAEHVDDHQVMIAQDLHRRGLALHRELEQLTWDDLCAVSGRTVDAARLAV